MSRAAARQTATSATIGTPAGPWSERRANQATVFVEATMTLQDLERKVRSAPAHLGADSQEGTRGGA